MIEPADIKALTKRDGRKAVLAMARDWAAIGVAIGVALWAHQPLVTIAALWVIGAFQHALGDILMHEAAHGNLFANKKMNDRTEILFGLPFLITLERYRTEHLRHHGQLGREEGDYLVGEYRAFGLDKPGSAIWIWLIRPLIGYPAWHYLRKLRSFPRRSLERLATLWGVAFALAALFGVLPEFLLYWVVPLVWCRYAFFYWSEISDHYHTRSGTRTRLGVLGNWFEHNRGYHLAHHRYPAVPWFNLPKLHDMMEPGDPDDMTDGPWQTSQQIASGLASAA